MAINQVKGMHMSRKIGLVFNGAIAIFLCVFVVYHRIFLPTAGASHVATLDRAGVLSEDRLKKYDSVMAINMRYNVAKFITQEHSEAISILLVVLGVVTNVNLCIFVWGKTMQKTKT